MMSVKTLPITPEFLAAKAGRAVTLRRLMLERSDPGDREQALAGYVEVLTVYRELTGATV